MPNQGTNPQYGQPLPPNKKFYDTNGNYVGYTDANGVYHSLTPAAPSAPASSAPPTPPAGQVPGQQTSRPSLASDPYYQQMLSLTQAQSMADAAARREAVQKALISFGLVPEGFQDRYRDISDLTRQLAQKNTVSGISTYARLLQSRKDTIRNLINALTARGLRRSGAKGFGLNRAQLSYDQNFSDALNSLLSFVQNAYSTFSQSEYSRQMALLQALQQASEYYVPSTGAGIGPYSPASATTWRNPGLNWTWPSSSSAAFTPMRTSGLVE